MVYKFMLIMRQRQLREEMWMQSSLLHIKSFKELGGHLCLGLMIITSFRKWNQKVSKKLGGQCWKILLGSLCWNCEWHWRVPRMLKVWGTSKDRIWVIYDFWVLSTKGHSLHGSFSGWKWNSRHSWILWLHTFCYPSYLLPWKVGLIYLRHFIKDQT